MKIAVVGTRGFPNVPGGVEAHCENLYSHLTGKGCEVIVFTRTPYVDITCGAYNGVRLIPLPYLQNKYLGTFLHTLLGLFAARRHSCDILHIHGIGPSLLAPIARLLGLKVIVTNHGSDYEREKWGRLAKLTLLLGEYLGTRYADGVICISKSIADRIRKKYGRDTAIIPNGVVLPQTLQDSAIVKKYGLTEGRYILSVGRFVPEKGFHDLIDAFDHIDDWKLVIAGDVDYSNRYALDLREKAKRNNNIILPGFLSGETLQQLYSQAGLFVLSSYYEGLPIVLLEAMSCGLSCIAADIPASRDAGLDNDRFFKAGDVKSLVLKIKEFINRPLTDKEKKKQIEMVAERYDWNSIADRTLEVYKQVISHVQKN